MAKIRYGPLVAQASGKVGGGVLVGARTGPVLRIRKTPKNPRTAQQLGVRSYLTAAARGFKTLSAANLALWNTYAASITKHNRTSGQSYHPAAIDAYTQLGSKFLQIAPGGVLPTAPPTSPYTPDASTVAAVGSAGTVTFTASADAVAGSTLECLLQRLPSANRVPTSRGYRTEAFSIAAHTTPVAVVHLQSDYLHPASVLPPGTYVPAYRFCKIATGEEGPLHVLPAVTVT